MLTFLDETEQKRTYVRNQLSPLLAKKSAVALFGAALNKDKEGMVKAGIGLGVSVLVDVGTNLGSQVLKQHKDPKKRIEQVNAYLAAYHPDTDPPVADTTAFDRVITNNRQTRAILANYYNLFDARDTVPLAAQEDGNGKIDTAMSSLKRGLADPTSRHPFGTLVGYNVYQMAGEKEAAFALLKRADNLDHAPLDYYQTLAHEYLTRGDREKAEAVIALGERNLRNEEYFLPLRVRMAREAGDEARMNALLARCRTVKNDNLVKVCQSSSENGTGALTDANMADEKTGVLSILQKLAGVESPVETVDEPVPSASASTGSSSPVQLAQAGNTPPVTAQAEPPATEEAAPKGPGKLLLGVLGKILGQ